MLRDPPEIALRPTNGSRPTGWEALVYKIKNWYVWACPFATQSLTSWGTGGIFAFRSIFFLLHNNEPLSRLQSTK